MTTFDKNGRARRAPRVVTASSENFRQLAGLWNTLSGAQKSSWQACAERMTSADRNAVPARATAYAAFVHVNTANLAAGGPVRADAPAPPPAPPALTVVAFTAAWAGGAPALSLSLPGYSGPVLVYGAAPRLAGRSVYRTTAFTLLGALDVPPGPSSPHDVGPLYAAKFRVLSPGYQITLRLVPVTATGFRGAPRLVTATAAAPADVLAPARGDARKAA